MPPKGTLSFRLRLNKEELKDVIEFEYLRLIISEVLEMFLKKKSSDE